MLFTATIVRKLNPPTVASQWKILSATSKNFSSSTGYSTEEIEKFRKVFRTMPSYEESISAKDIKPFLEAVNYNKPQETYQWYIRYGETILGGRYELDRLMRYFNAQHDPTQIFNEYLIDFDTDNDGYISKEEFSYGIATLQTHDQRVKTISYEQFMKEADTNKDGKVSVAECNEWIKNYIVPSLG